MPIKLNGLIFMSYWRSQSEGRAVAGLGFAYEKITTRISSRIYYCNTALTSSSRCFDYNLSIGIIILYLFSPESPPVLQQIVRINTHFIRLQLHHRCTCTRTFTELINPRACSNLYWSYRLYCLPGGEEKFPRHSIV